MRSVILLLSFVVLLGSGCREQGGLPVSNVATDVRIERNDKALSDPVYVDAGVGLDVILSYVPVAPSPEEFDGRIVQPHDKWRVLWELRDASGEYLLPEGHQVYEFRTFDWVGVGKTQDPTDPFGGEVVWRSPAQPAELIADRDYCWGHVGTPLKSGSYRLKILLHPTADPRSPHETIVEWGPAVTLFEGDIIVSDSGSNATLPTEVLFTRRDDAGPDGMPRRTY